MTRTTIRMLPLLALGLVSSGCLEVAVITAATSSSRGSGSSSTSPASRPPSSSSSSTGAPVTVSDAQLSGTMGDIAATDSASAQSDSDSVVQLDVHQNAAHGWMMTRISLGGQRFADLQVGRTYDSSIDPLVAIGCSGPTDGDYTFDSSPMFTSMTVEQGPTADDRVANVQMDFENAAGERQHVAARFTYRAQ